MRAIVLVWLFTTILTNAPFLRAALDPPQGTRFVGTFHWIDDFYNYASFVQQAEDGRFFFHNKMVIEPHRSVLVNLEWWLVGRLSAALGRRPFLAYRGLAVIGSFFLLAGVDRWLRHGGLGAAHRLAALWLVALGGGLGGILFELTDLPIWHCVDIAIGLFPFIEMLSNPHWAFATALLLWSLLAFTSARGWRGYLWANVLGTALSLVRPYDFVLLVAIRSLTVVCTEPPSSWFRRLAPLAGLAPVCLYAFWLYYRHPAFSFYSQLTFPIAPRLDFLLALAPTLLLAVLAVWPRSGSDGARRNRVPLLMWIAVALTIMLVRPVPYAQQFLVGVGLPLLVLSAIGLSRFRPAVTIIVMVPLASMAVTATRIVLRPDPHWFVPVAHLDAAQRLREHCRSGEIVLAPPQIGLYVMGLTPCTSYVAHEAAPNYARRASEVSTFYRRPDQAWRNALLERIAASYVLLPGDPGTVPTAWLGEATPFRQIARVGDGPSQISLYARGGTDQSPAR